MQSFVILSGTSVATPRTRPGFERSACTGPGPSWPDDSSPTSGRFLAC